MVERDDRAPVATFLSEAALAVGAVATLGEGPAHHARVKRLDAGDRIRLTDGLGRVATGSVATIGKSALEVAIDSVVTVAPPQAIHLRVPVGDRDRMLWLAEKATELGIATWQAVRFRRSASVSPRGEGGAFADKVRARMVSALEQSGGAWLPTILGDTTPDALVVNSGEAPILLDQSGQPWLKVVGLAGSAAPVVLFGPEGGLEAAELAALTAASWQRTRLADSTLRFETAGVAAVAAFRAATMLDNA